jgi:hypothetical protein
LPFQQQQDDRLAGAIADGIELRVQAALHTPDTGRTSPFEPARRSVVWLQAGGADHDTPGA